MAAGTFQHLLLHPVQDFLNLFGKLFKAYRVFFSGIPAADYSLSVFNILRTALDTYRDASHFLLCELEARALICSVHFHAHTSFF